MTKKEYKLIKKKNKTDFKTSKQKIKYDYKINKRNLKKDAKLQKEELKNLYKKSKNSNFEKEENVNLLTQNNAVNNAQTKPVVNPPKRSILEEIGNAISHGLGAIFAIIALVLMLTHSSSTKEIIAAIIYFIGLLFMFTMSCLYHSFKFGSTVKRIFRRFDYSCIYLLIGATFAPIFLIYIGGILGYVLFGIQWAIVITGITLISVFGPTRLRLIHFTLYILLGWSALLFLPNMIANNLNLFLWVLGGGLSYTLGIIPFAMNKKVAHFIWHFFVLFGAVIQWIGIYLCLYVV